MKIMLNEDQLPKYWYNILPDLPRPIPPPIDPLEEESRIKILKDILPRELLRQEMSMDRHIKIPEEVIDAYRLWRPTPLFRAIRLERALKTPARIYYKYEGVSPPGSHKPNTAIAQAYYNSKEGVERLTTETGAGQWGSALAFGCNMFGLSSTVYMVKVSYHQKPYRKTMMKLWGAEVIPSPSSRTEFGKEILKEDPNNPGSLGIAIGEALEDAVVHENTKYSLGSVLNHVLIHQTIIGKETKEQLQLVDEYPDMIVGCVGGGSSFSGLFWTFYHDQVSGKALKDVNFLAVESAACPSLTRGYYTYDHCDTARITPLLKMYTIGHSFIPPPIHSGGLRFHGMAPTLSLLVREDIVDTRAYDQIEVFNGANLFTKTEGILPAPEPAHAIKAVIDEALKCKETHEEKTILFLLCGHGHFDMQAYDDYLNGKLLLYEYSGEKVEDSMRKLKKTYPWLNGELKEFE